MAGDVSGCEFAGVAIFYLKTPAVFIHKCRCDLEACVGVMFNESACDISIFIEASPSCGIGCGAHTDSVCCEGADDMIELEAFIFREVDGVCGIASQALHVESRKQH